MELILENSWRGRDTNMGRSQGPMCFKNDLGKRDMGRQYGRVSMVLGSVKLGNWGGVRTLLDSCCQNVRRR